MFKFNRLVLLFIPIIAALAFSIFPPQSGISHKVNKLENGIKMPDMELKELITDARIHSKELEGKPYLLNVWASWCVACKKEHNFLLELQRRGVNIVGLNYMDTSPQALALLNISANPYEKVLYDPEGKFSETFEIRGLPETFLVNESGEILYRHRGTLKPQSWNVLEPVWEKLTD